MERQLFDDLSRRVARSSSRRDMLKGLVGGMIGTGLAAGAWRSTEATGTATITIHKAICPTSLQGDLYGNCHDLREPGVVFMVGDEILQTDDQGVLSWTVPAGNLRIEESDAFLVDGVYVYCRDLVSDTVIYEGNDDDGIITVPIATGMDVVCDWYNLVPDDVEPGATLTMHKSVCPVNLADDLFGNCHDRRLNGVDFVINEGIYTTAGGGLINVALTAGVVAIDEDPDAIDQGVYVYCRDTVSDTVLIDGRYDEGGVTFTILDGMAVTCDWYNLIPAEDGEKPTDDNGDAIDLPDTGVAAAGGTKGLLFGATAAAAVAALLGRSAKTH